MSVDAVLLSSQTVEWPTPAGIFDALNAEFSFDLDPCATHENAKCARYFTEAEDGLAQEWTGTVFMNPPYGRGIGAWIQKAYQSARNGAVVVCLIPARTDTRWWHDYVMKAEEIRFLRGRLHFGDGAGRATFPSAVVVFR